MRSIDTIFLLASIVKFLYTSVKYFYTLKNPFYLKH